MSGKSDANIPKDTLHRCLRKCKNIVKKIYIYLANRITKRPEWIGLENTLHVSTHLLLCESRLLQSVTERSGIWIVVIPLIVTSMASGNSHIRSSVDDKVSSL